MNSIFLYEASYSIAAVLRHEGYRDLKVVGSIENSIDGSGPWKGVHLLDENGNWMGGGWFEECNAQPTTSAAPQPANP
jgi:hypothetical protein